LTTETNRAIFSSFKHFKTSEDAAGDPFTIFLIIANVLFGLSYLVLYICEVIRSFLDIRRLQFSQKIGHLITVMMVFMTLFVLITKVSR